MGNWYNLLLYFSEEDVENCDDYLSDCNCESLEIDVGEYGRNCQNLISNLCSDDEPQKYYFDDLLDIFNSLLEEVDMIELYTTHHEYINDTDNYYELSYLAEILNVMRTNKHTFVWMRLVYC